LLRAGAHGVTAAQQLHPGGSMNKKSALPANLCLLAVAISMGAPAFADDEEPQGLQEVTVTARRKVESIQDVPVAVSAVSAADLERAFTLDTTSLRAYAPNVVFDTIEMGTPGGGGFSIRGISYQDVDKGFDPTVLVSLDDVPLATGTGQVFDLIDIESIEVLRGPQGTLFGKNVVGGLINIHRVRPKLNDTSGKVRVRAGSFEKYSGDVLFNYGQDTWAIKLTGGLERQDKGFIKNDQGGRLWDRDEDRFGAHILWAPNEVFTGELIADYSKLGGTPGAVFDMSIDAKDIFCLLTQVYDGLGVPPGGVYCSGTPNEPGTKDRDTSSADFKTHNELEKKALTARLTANLTDDHTLTYIGSWLDADDDQSLDGDATPYPIYHFRRWGGYRQISNELRLSRDKGSNLTWQAGFFQAFAEGTNNQNTILTLLDPTCATPDPCTYEFGRTTSESYSVFGEADLAMLDQRLVFTAGLRYINETKKLARSVFSFARDSYDLPPNSGGSRTDSKTIYRLGARYHFTDDVMGYVTTSTGFRSGGLSPRAQTAAVLADGYDPEELTNYEVGLRTTAFNKRVILNLTAFQMDYKDMQIELAVPSIDENGNPVGTGTQLSIENAGKARVKGLEMDFQWLATDWLTLSGNAGYLDAKYRDLFVNIWGDLDPLTNQLLPPEDETDLKLRRAPKYTYALNSTVNWKVGPGTMYWRAGWNWTDKYEATITNYPGSSIDSYGTLDSSLTFEQGNWQLSLFGRNLTDDDSWTHNYVVNPIRPTATDPAPGTLWRFAQRRAPREIGLEFQYKF
jgi:iron complex outermembrane receptor protein